MKDERKTKKQLIEELNELRKTSEKLFREKQALIENEKRYGAALNDISDHTQGAVRTLAGGIAHDFNNILGAIIGYAEMMELFNPPEDELSMSRLEGILRGAYRAKDLVQQILTFSRQTEIEKTPLRFDLIIKESLKFFRASLPSTIELRQNINSQNANILATPTQVHQILINLFSNAAHPIRKNGGVLNIVLNETELTNQDEHVKLNLEPGPYLVLTVESTVVNTHTDTAMKDFNSFQSLNEPDEYNHMHVQTVQGIINSINGGMILSTKPDLIKTGISYVFKVFLPLIKNKPQAPPVYSHSSIPKGNESILLVDDEDTILDVNKKILENIGYSVVATTNGLEALNLFLEKPNVFDLVITDMTMPRKNGIQLAKEILNIRPEMAIILCTGYRDLVSSEDVKSAGIREFLTKPVDIQNLAVAVRRVLDGK